MIRKRKRPGKGKRGNKPNLLAPDLTFAGILGKIAKGDGFSEYEIFFSHVSEQLKTYYSGGLNMFLSPQLNLVFIFHHFNLTKNWDIFI